MATSKTPAGSMLYSRRARLFIHLKWHVGASHFTWELGGNGHALNLVIGALVTSRTGMSWVPPAGFLRHQAHGPRRARVLQV